MRLFKSGKENKPLDRNTFEEIFRLYYQPLCRFCAGIVQDMDTAEEIVQDFFFHFWQDNSTLNISVSLKSYLYKAIYNNALKHLRKQAVRQKYATSQAAAPHFSNPTIIENMQGKQMQAMVEEILNNMPERTATIFRMSRFDELKYREIATILSISVKTVEANMGKALAVFREKLNPHNATYYN